MKLAINILSIINFILALVSFMPCLMAGGMSMDSPQAQNSVLSHFLCYLILSFPIICLFGSIAPQFIDNKFSIYIALFPICEMTLFFATIYFLTLYQQKI